ncbi:MAG: fibrobacter succinogenes major paralogous domain-containing protein [Bacteroidales bacterium]|nr:fibrobacter succinogenes major paralogous domain-containing protein [Bacteroidales bacterium]
MSTRLHSYHQSFFRVIALNSLLLLIFTSGCQKIDYRRIVKLQTGEFSQLTAISVQVQGNLLDMGDDAVTQHGICYATQENPTLNDQVGNLGEAEIAGTYSVSLSALAPATTYYYRAYARIGEEVVYAGEVKNFTTRDGMVDISTTGSSEVTASSFTIGGTIENDGGAAVTSRGICWGTSPNPTVDNNPITLGEGTGSFSTNITDLEMNVTYYIRAWATNAIGTCYSNQVELTLWFNTAGPNVSDIDGNNYNSRRIGTQTWLVQNLKTTRYNNGADIPLETNVSDWTYKTTPAYCWYSNDVENKTPYGALYNWYTVREGNLCPTGWHVPGKEEFKILADYLISTELTTPTAIGGMLKSTDPVWASGNTGASNATGFSGMPAGGRGANTADPGDFGISYSLYLWSSTSEIDGSATARSLSALDAGFGEGVYPVELGASVRCIQD